jgi:putative hydrolase of the HAD superfamily
MLMSCVRIIPFLKYRVMLKNYKAVFFDVGGTLLRVHPSVGDVYATHARDFGFNGSADDLNREFKQEWSNMGGMESLGRQSGLTVERAFWKELVRRVFAAHGGLNDLDRYFELIYDVFRNKESWRVFEDVTESRLLDQLKANGVVLGVISNWDSRLPEILENTGLAPYFNFILASTVVGSAKPDAGIFREALKRAGVTPEQACHIGDEPATDIAGAHNVGINSILIDRKGNHDGEAVTRVKSFHQLI